ncbi:DUF523 domain-containing protein [Vibrio sinensis]|uniref:DUF523 domain-containing protein n=1 Tax=Vibrio sinensis TaxID=2302434 RepID=A0A3A6QQI5_9VIBR|nr:DUF523 domain-containing protein [Vibrio sinensis]RJX72876.1 DUF523 domain-containing protein [Vibrio sinensis]
MEKILVSSCLVGNSVRYNGSCLSLDNADRDWLFSSFDVLTFCPEVSSGLPTPRPPAEIIGGVGEDVLENNARVVGNDGVDVTELFLSGADNTLKLCLENQIRYAILAESSPSCGSVTIYDGTFSGHKIAGRGVTAALLEQHEIKVFSQYSLAKLRAEVDTITPKVVSKQCLKL